MPGDESEAVATGGSGGDNLLVRLLASVAGGREEGDGGLDTEEVDDAALRRCLRRVRLNPSSATARTLEQWQQAARLKPLAVRLAAGSGRGGRGRFAVDLHVLPPGAALPLPRLHHSGQRVLTRVLTGAVEATECRSTPAPPAAASSGNHV